MNLAHVHLLLNHVPTIGTLIALGLFLLALVRKDQGLERVSLGLFCVIALVSIVAYESGNSARTVIATDTNVSDVMVIAHQNAAMQAFVFMMIAGTLAWFALWQYHGPSPRLAPTRAAVLLVSLVTVVLMSRAATMGGEIRHPEIRTTQDAAAAAVQPGWFSATAVARMVSQHPLVWSTCETFHFIGLSFLFGAGSLVSLRMLGFMKNMPFDPIRLLPLGLVGFGINVVTGMIFFMATPGQYTENIAFYWKMALMLVAGGNILYLMVFDEAWKMGPGDEASRVAKVLSASTIALWVGVMYFGRMLPFLGNSF